MKRLALLVGVVLLLVACGGSGGSGEADQVKQDWTTFFSPKTAPAEKAAMLQDGARFKSAIAALEKNPFASSISAQVSSVTLEGANKAKVVYTIYVGKTAARDHSVGERCCTIGTRTRWCPDTVSTVSGLAAASGAERALVRISPAAIAGRCRRSRCLPTVSVGEEDRQALRALCV